MEKIQAWAKKHIEIKEDSTDQQRKGRRESNMSNLPRRRNCSSHPIESEYGSNPKAGISYALVDMPKPTNRQMGLNWDEWA
ncbi:hypothetical protein CR513_35991, partial [Mucuna pruriens]